METDEDFLDDSLLRQSEQSVSHTTQSHGGPSTTTVINKLGDDEGKGIAGMRDAQ